nr:hypothetical protein [Tanacetum cinerariifolium]
MRRVAKGFSRVNKPLFEGMLVPQQAADDVDNVAADDVVADVAETTLRRPAATPLPPQELPSTLQVTYTPASSPHQSLIAPPSSPPQPSQPSHTTTISMELLNNLLETCSALTIRVENLDQDKIAQALEITKLKQRVGRLEKTKKLKVFGLKRLRKEVAAEVVKKDVKVAEDADVQGRLKESQAQVYHIDLEHVDKVLSIAARRRKGVVIRDPEETATPSTIVHSEPKSKDKGKVFQFQCGFLGKKELEEEESMALKWKSESSEKKATKKQKLDEEVEELEKHLQIVPNDEDDVYTEATPLALKVPVVDYQIHIKNNKPYYKIIRADGTHQLFQSFLSLLRNFDREDLEMLWQIVQERFASSKPKNFSDDFLLTTFKAMFEKPDVKAQV